MANIDSINKEGLFSLVKRITEQNSPFSNKLQLKSSKYHNHILLNNFLPNTIKYSPKKEQSNSYNNPVRNSITFKNKFLEENNIQINKQNVLHLLSQRRKLKTYRNDNGNSNTNINNKYVDKIMKGKTIFINLEEDNININNNKGKKIIKNSNSEFFDKNMNNNINKNLSKNLLLLKSPKLDMDTLIKNSKSFFKMFNNNKNDNDNNKGNKNNINNNININININGNLNNNKQINDIFKPNKRYANLENNTDTNKEGINHINHNNNLIRKKYHKIFYLNNINKSEEDDNNQDNKIKKETEPNNTVNINVNFMSNPKDDFPNKRITTNTDIGRLNLSKYNFPSEDNHINLRKSTNIHYIKSPKLKNFFNINSSKPKENIPLRNISYLKRNVIKTSKTSIYNEKSFENFEEKINKNKIDIIQIEDLLILEGKFCHLINCLKYDNPLPKMCAEWWNFYTYSSYFGKFPKLFPKIIKGNFISDYEIAHNSILFELLSIIITYEILAEKNLRKRLIKNLMEIINKIHLNFLIECDYILSKVDNKSLNNLWIKKLKNIIILKKNWKENNNHLNLLHQRNNLIHNKIHYLISTCHDIISHNNKNEIDIDLNTLSYFNNNIPNLPLVELNEYFTYVINKENVKINKAFFHKIKRNNLISRKKYNNYNIISIPYLPKMNDRNKYTLVLDLDETLISFRINDSNKEILKMRPGLFDFLRKVKTRYELVIFTAGTKEYAEPIIDSIEKKEKFFLKRLYRNHTVYKDNIYIKDLTKLGRDLSKIIIVDNMPQNFCLQKENGILISNYFGQDNGDNTLDLLGDILLKIAQRSGRDVRNEIKKYKEEIFTKITTNLEG